MHDDGTSDSPYRITKDTDGKLLSVSLLCLGKDDIAISIGPGSRAYCEFLTWACNQKTPVAAGLERLEPQALYFAHADGVADYCRKEGIVLSIRPASEGPTLTSSMDDSPMEVPLSIYHSRQIDASWHGKPGRLFFYRLYRAEGAATVDSNHRTDEFDGTARLPVFVTADLHSRLIELLREENSDIRRLSSWPVERTFVYVDVSEFSRFSPAYQLGIINSLVQITNSDQWWPAGSVATEARADREASLCIGDGYIFVFGKPWMGAYFASYLAALIERLIATGDLAEFHFRIGVHTGPVYRFWDKWGTGPGDGRWNYIGRGITDGQRVLSAIGQDKDDVVFVSADTRRQVLARYSRGDTLDMGPWLQNRGRRADKHGELRRVYEVSHTAWMGQAQELFVHTSPNCEGKS